MLVTEKVLVTATPNRAPVVPGSYSWLSSDASLVDLVPQGDGAQCWVIAKGIPGSVIITASALPSPDLPLIFGSTEIPLTLDFSTELILTLSTPEPI